VRNKTKCNKKNLLNVAGMLIGRGGSNGPPSGIGIGGTKGGRNGGTSGGGKRIETYGIGPKGGKNGGGSIGGLQTDR
jgi:hypothetical protein